jgi:hypothetical protein
VYGVVVLVLAFAAGVRLARVRNDDERARSREAQVWLALVILASLRGPFVPDAYAMVGALWLLTLVAADAQRLSWQRGAALILAGIMLSTVLENNIPLQTVVPIVVFSMCRDVLVLSLAIWTIVYYWFVGWRSFPEDSRRIACGHTAADADVCLPGTRP